MDGNNSIRHFLPQSYNELPTCNAPSLNFFYANVRSICKTGKFDELQCILKSIPCTTHCIVLTETWFKTDQEAQSFHLPNYSHIYNYRQDKRGGGVSIYIHNSLQYDLAEDIYEDGIHYLWIYLQKFTLYIGGIYNPGKKNLNTFLDKYLSQLENKKRGIVFGDFNIDLLCENRETCNYTDILKIAGYDIWIQHPRNNDK